MSRMFLWCAVVFSALMLLLNASNLERAKPMVMAFWLIVGGACAYKLFHRRERAG